MRSLQDWFPGQVTAVLTASSTTASPALDPEKAHRLGFRAVRAARPVLARRRTPGAPVTAMGLTFPNVLGLAAGFDKNAVGIDALGALGFGHVEVGTVTGEPQPGNAEAAAVPADRGPRRRQPDGLQQRRRRGRGRAGSPRAVAAGRRAGPVLGVNIGKSKVVPEDEAVRDYEKSARLLAPHADYLVVNVSSPNTPGLRNLQAVEKLEPILPCGAATVAGDVPLLVKIAPDLADDDVLAVADLATAIDLDGIIATNTTISRDGLASTPEQVEAAGAGGLSGRPLNERVARRDADAPRPGRRRAHPDRCRRHHDRRRRPAPASTPAPTCCRATRRSSTRGRAGPAGSHQGSVSDHVRQPASPPPSRTRGPLCAGIDPHAGLLAEWGLPDDVSGLERFALTAVEGLAPYVAVVKPQSAFYERFGSRGVAVLERVIAESRAAGALVLLDVKRGDIGSTTQAYADAYLDPTSPLAADAITASPVPRLRLARPDGRHRPQARRRAVRAGADLQQGGAGGAARRAPRTAQLVAGRILDHLRGAQRGAGAARLVRRGHRRDDRRRARRLDFDFNGPILAPGLRRPGRHRRRHPAHLRLGRRRR